MQNRTFLNSVVTYGRLWLLLLGTATLFACGGRDGLTGTSTSSADGSQTTGDSVALDGKDLTGDQSDTATTGVTDALQSEVGDADTAGLAGTDATTDTDELKDGGDVGTDAADGAQTDATVGSCVGQCGKAQTSSGCGCDADCVKLGKCCPDFDAACKDIGYCGDGKCTPEELSVACLADCQVKGDDSCLLAQCPSYAKCLADVSCAKVLKCVHGCKTDACIGACGIKKWGSSDTAKILKELAPCAKTQCQITLPVLGGLCGDGQCMDFEIDAGCTVDCKGCTKGLCDTDIQPAWTSGCSACFTFADTPAAQCAQTHCGNDWKSFCGFACRQEFACMEVYGSLDVCASGQYGANNLDLLVCAKQKGCFQPTKTWTCAGKCGQTFADQPCSCDQTCLSEGTCCKDFASLCPDMAKEHCGDGTCAPSTGETLDNCPLDCTPKPCTSTAVCDLGQVCCDNGSNVWCRWANECK